MGQSSCRYVFEILLGYPSIPVWLQYAQCHVRIEHLTHRVLVDDVTIVRAFEYARGYPGLVICQVPCAIIIHKSLNTGHISDTHLENEPTTSCPWKTPFNISMPCDKYGRVELTDLQPVWVSTHIGRLVKW